MKEIQLRYDEVCLTGPKVDSGPETGFGAQMENRRKLTGFG